jgi:formylglycine-generating enzyme required for sulfatase activity
MHLPAVFPDPFAVEWGHDQYGTFQSFAVGDVVQRMRWIPPGSFMMGSPESEVGRSSGEIQHYVELTRGYWLADTPVTQELWQSVMRINPSQFVDPYEPGRPVEQVRWYNCQEFVRRLNERIDGLDARLPTEAQWEYACRAGTVTATWIGNLEPSQEIEAPQLDAISWCDLNSGSTTHPVGQKEPNPWGLYDMLGNVYDWCMDWYSEYEPTFQQDPCGIDLGAYRVFRGGSWSSRAKRVRAAKRFAEHPHFYDNRLGFRLARSATPKP